MALIPINQENITSSFRFSIGSKLARIQVFWLGDECANLTPVIQFDGF